LKPGLFISYRKHTRKARSVTQGDLEEKRSTIGLRDEWHEVKAVYCFIAPEGLKNLAQGFNPGKHPIKRFALKGREMAWAKCPSNATEQELGIC
jgi:hypothetical protein